MRETFEAIRVLGFWRTLWLSTLYRPVMRWMHRHHLHYLKECHPEGDTMLWCEWCGVRYVMPRNKSEPPTVNEPS